jgi:hypothetical protein
MRIAPGVGGRTLRIRLLAMNSNASGRVMINSVEVGEVKMNWRVVLAAAALPIVGCTVQPGAITPPSIGIAMPGLVFPGIVAPVAVDDAIVIDGVSYDPIFIDGRWGYYDRYHHFRDAPDRDRRRFESRYPGGRGFAGRGGMGGHPGGIQRAAAGGHAAPAKAAPSKGDKKK